MKKIGTIDSLTFKSPKNILETVVNHFKSIHSGKKQDQIHLKKLSNKSVFFVSEITKAKQQIGIGIQIIYQTQETVLSGNPNIKKTVEITMHSGVFFWGVLI